MSLLFRDPPNSVLIEAPHVRGINALLARKDREYAPTEAMPPSLPPLPIIEWQERGQAARNVPHRWPLMTRVRLWLASKLIGL